MGHNDRGAQRPGAQWHLGHSDPGHNDTGFSKMTKNISKFSYPIMGHNAPGHNEPGHNDMLPFKCDPPAQNESEVPNITFWVVQRF